MSEDEFLRNFSNKIVSKFEVGNERGYVLLLKYGNRFTVFFKDKKLESSSWNYKHTDGTLNELMNE